MCPIAVKSFCTTLHKRAVISNLGGRLTAALQGASLTVEQQQRLRMKLQAKSANGTSLQ